MNSISVRISTNKIEWKGDFTSPPTAHKKKYLPRLPTERDGTLSNAKLRMASGHQYSPGGLHRLSESASSSPTTWRVRPWWFAHSLGVSLFISDGNKRRQRGHTSSSSSSSSSSSRFSDGGAWPSVLSANPPSLFIGEACTHVPRITHLRFLRAASETFPWHSLPNGLEVLLLLLLFSFFFFVPAPLPSTFDHFIFKKKIFLYLRGHRPTVRPRELSKFHSLLHQDPCAIPVNPFMGNDSRITSYGKRMGQQKKKRNEGNSLLPSSTSRTFSKPPPSNIPSSERCFDR